MLPSVGLFNRTFSVLAEVRQEYKLDKLTDINSIRPASSKRLKKGKEAVYGAMLQAAERKLQMSWFSGILSILNIL